MSPSRTRLRMLGIVTIRELTSCLIFAPTVVESNHTARNVLTFSSLPEDRPSLRRMGGSRMLV